MAAADREWFFIRACSILVVVGIGACVFVYLRQADMRKELANVVLKTENMADELAKVVFKTRDMPSPGSNHSKGSGSGSNRGRGGGT